MQRGFDESEAMNEVAALASQGLVDDERFATALVRVRSERGHGPLRIRRDLEARGVETSVIEGCLASNDEEWIERARRARGKRFGAVEPDAGREYLRQARFLAGRGFSRWQIRRALEDMGAK